MEPTMTCTHDKSTTASTTKEATGNMMRPVKLGEVQPLLIVLYGSAAGASCETASAAKLGRQGVAGAALQASVWAELSCCVSRPAACLTLPVARCISIHGGLMGASSDGYPRPAAHSTLLLGGAGASCPTMMRFWIYLICQCLL